MTQLLTLAFLFGLLGYLRRRKNAPSAHLPSTYKVTSWDEFRRYVVEATGRSTVFGNPEVAEYPGGWLVFEDLAHQVTEAAMPLEEALERGPCQTVGQVAVPGDEETYSPFDPSAGVTVVPASPSPWIGRRVWAYGRDRGVVVREAFSGFLVTGEVPYDGCWPHQAELHWDDVRAGDVQIADAFRFDAVARDVVGRDGHQLHVVGLAREFTIVPTSGDRFLPAGVQA